MTLSLIQSLDDAAVIALVPGVVAVLRRAGVPERYGPVCAVASAIALVILADLASNGEAVSVARTAAWLLTGLIDGLAAAGLARVAPGAMPPPPLKRAGPYRGGVGSTHEA